MTNKITFILCHSQIILYKHIFFHLLILNALYSKLLKLFMVLKENIVQVQYTGIII